ncbi:MAG: hypothetical protein KDA20_06130 [Phycisphaerales bacterium]|nr:hypothetical protein [Phycisphaerales bacterium]
MHAARTSPALGDRLNVAIEVAKAAGRITLDYFNSASLGIEEKADGTPVTEADRNAELYIRDEIQMRFPDDGFMGEEFGSIAGTSGLRWIVDPIDGTKSFVHGVPLYGCLVAVEAMGANERDHESLVGVVHMPALGETVYASRGGGAWCAQGDAKPVQARVSATARLRDAMFVYTSHDYFKMTGQTEVLNALLARCGHTRGWSDCYAHLLVATGRADIVVEPAVLHPWDIAPMTVIVAEAGGRCTDWRGAATAYGKTGVSTNARLYDEVMALIQGM